MNDLPTPPLRLRELDRSTSAATARSSSAAYPALPVNSLPRSGQANPGRSSGSSARSTTLPAQPSDRHSASTKTPSLASDVDPLPIAPNPD